MSIDPLHSVSQRTLQSVRSHLLGGRVAFYLGAGVDQQLAEDANQPEKAPSWEELLSAMKPFPKADPSELSRYAKDWPTETALAARLRLGKQEFKDRIAASTDVGFSPDPTKPFTKNFAALLLKSNLIVTTNYTSHIIASLRAYVKRNGLTKSKEFIVVTREDLASFPFPQAEVDPSRIYVVHIHGRCVERSDLVFDAWGYNIAVNDDRHYHRFLYNLFSHRSVISIGVSWSDIPLRNQAALVFRTQGYQRPCHVSFDHYETRRQCKRAHTANGASREWSNAIHATYGVRMIPVTTPDLRSIIQYVSDSKGIIDLPRRDDVAGIAKFLDSCGDYESPVQQQWLLNLSHSKTRSAAAQLEATVTDQYRRLFRTVSEDRTTWESVARIERHLRHFHYLYAHRLVKARQDLWNLLASKLTKGIWRQLDDRLQFNFLVGQYELKIARPVSLDRFHIDNKLYRERVKISSALWRSPPAPKPAESYKRIDSYKTTALRLLDLGWESMASKVFLDAATVFATMARDSYHPTIGRSIVQLASQGGDVARSAGYFRREAKSEALIAIFLPDPQESRIRILSKIRAAESASPRSDGTAGVKYGVVEPALIASLTAGLLASHIRSLDMNSDSEAMLIKKLKDSVRYLLLEAGLDCDEVPLSLLPYWETFVENRLSTPFLKSIAFIQKK